MRAPGIACETPLTISGTGLALAAVSIEQDAAYWEWHVEIPKGDSKDVMCKRDMHTVDYMTVDTERSEVDIVLDFPWDDFDIRVVQIEQLVSEKYWALS
jgi:hypothetical protein